MKKIYTLFLFALLTLGVQAQVDINFTFEDANSATKWLHFENGTDTTIQTLTVVENLLINDINGSDSVLQFIVKDDSKTWVGMYTDTVEVMAFTEEAHSISMMVYKPQISPMRIKVELSATGGEDFSITMENTYTDDWELITFDFSDAIPHYYQRLTIFPDFPATRDGGSTIYIDNIGSAEINTAVYEQASGLSLKIYPNPVKNRMSVQYPEMTGISVSDMQGKTLKSISFELRDNKIIELGDLEPGAYIVTAETRTGHYSGTFIKK
jgi:hypothetical protein